ncbi:MAG: hypothetical protein Pg6A_01890 [Termitinemataceae bacterium]|nr:MAG: hypothetical protein Pg6A_01890 [Termitinemataceae bacterium]
MNTNLVNIVKGIIANNGETVLADPQRLKAFFGDLAKDEPKPLRVAFGRCIEEGAYNALKTASGQSERAKRKTAIAQRVRDEQGMDIALCAEALDILEAALFDTTPAAYQQPIQQDQPQSPAQTTPAPVYTEPSPVYATPENAAAVPTPAKKNTLRNVLIAAAAAALVIAAAVIAVPHILDAVGPKEYTLYFSGDDTGIVTITKGTDGKIIILPKLDEGAIFYITHDVCPLLREERKYKVENITSYFYVSVTRDIVIDGNTTTKTDSDGSWEKTVIDGNTTTKTDSDGSWEKTVIDGNTTTKTDSDGSWEKTVVDGNTTTGTSSDGNWAKTVVDGNTTTWTSSDGNWAKTVVDGNTTTWTTSYGSWEKTVVDGNTTTWTDSDGSWRQTVVDGNTTTETELNGNVQKTTIDKQDYNVYIHKISSESLVYSGNRYNNEKQYDKAIA